MVKGLPMTVYWGQQCCLRPGSALTNGLHGLWLLRTRGRRDNRLAVGRTLIPHAD